MKVKKNKEMDDYFSKLAKKLNLLPRKQAEAEAMAAGDFTCKNTIELIFLLAKLTNGIKWNYDGYMLPPCISRVEAEQLIELINELNYQLISAPVYVTCEVCEGEGVTDTFSCSRQMSDCCGGCTVETKCEECGGRGFLNL